jgi:hypothetical protein
MNETLDPRVAVQLERLGLEPDRPLIICDADEVLFAFMAGFAPYLERMGHYFAWQAYQLSGHVRRRDNDQPIDDEAIEALLAGYWDEAAEAMGLVPEAPEALRALSRHAGVVILTNVPFEHHERRIRTLARHDLGYPTIANAGPKGPAVRWLAERAGRPAFFIDDSPRHHRSVAAHAGEVIRLHFVGDARLAALSPTAPDCHHRTDSWAEARAVIEAALARAGVVPAETA